MTSIRTLELITGETMGYDHAAPERQREAAVLRWAEWYRQQHDQDLDGGAEAEPDSDLRFQASGRG